MREEIDITGIDKAELLASLWNQQLVTGLGFLVDRKELTVEDARTYIEKWRLKDSDVVSFDWIAGRPIKVAFVGNALRHADLYDRDNPCGPGSCRRIVDGLRALNAERKKP